MTGDFERDTPEDFYTLQTVNSKSTISTISKPQLKPATPFLKHLTNLTEKVKLFTDTFYAKEPRRAGLKKYAEIKVAHQKQTHHLKHNSAEPTIDYETKLSLIRKQTPTPNLKKAFSSQSDFQKYDLGKNQKIVRVSVIKFDQS